MSNDKFERRSFATHIEARSAGGKKFLIGRAASYNTLSADLGGFQEVLAPGAFARAVREKDDAVFTINHDKMALPLGRVSSGTLQLSEDDKGLLCRCDLPNTQAAHDLYESVQRGDIREMSFAFNVWPLDNESWDNEVDEDGRKFVKRTVKGVKLWDVAAVLRPAYPTGTNVSTDMLTAPNVSSLQVVVSPRALAEARSRGIALRTDATRRAEAAQHAAVIANDNQPSIHHERMTDAEIAEARRELSLEQSVEREKSTDRNHGRRPAGRIGRRG